MLNRFVGCLGLWLLNICRLYNAVYIFNLGFLKEYFADNVLNEQDLICLHTLKWFQFIISFGTTLFLSRRTEYHYFDIIKQIAQMIHLEKSLSDESKIFTFYENMFNGARHLPCQTLWLLFLFQYERVSKPCMANLQLDLEEFIVDISIPAALPFCINNFVAFEFQVSMCNPEFVWSQI